MGQARESGVVGSRVAGLGAGAGWPAVLRV